MHHFLNHRGRRYYGGHFTRQPLPRSRQSRQERARVGPAERQSSGEARGKPDISWPQGQRLLCCLFPIQQGAYLWKFRQDHQNVGAAATLPEL